MKTASETQSEATASSAPEPGSVEALLLETGIAVLTVSAKAADQEAALQALAVSAADLPPLRRALRRDQAVQALKRGGFESPTRLVDVALPRSSGGDSTNGPGSDLLVGAPQPWPEPVDGAALIGDIEGAVTAHAVLPDGAAAAM